MDKQTELYLLQNLERLNSQVRSLSKELEETTDTANHCWSELDKLNYHLEVEHN